MDLCRCSRYCAAMAHREDNMLQERFFSARIQDEASSDPSDVCLSTLSANDDIIVIDPITPPLSSLSAVDKGQPVTPKPVTAGRHGVTSATSLDHIFTGMNKNPLGVYGTIPSWIMRTAPHKCSLCHEVFSTVKMLNKHLLTHHQDGQHVCPVCQRSFKCHDHLVHLVTHQKNLFQSTTPGSWQRCCFDGHSLHHHQCSPHHGGCLISTSSQTVSRNPVDPVEAQWKACSVAGVPHLAGSADYIDCCSIFPVPPKPMPETQYIIRNCGTFKKEPSYLGFSSVGGLGVRSFPSQALDPWLQGDGKSPSDDQEHEPRPHQRTFCGLQHRCSLKPEPSSKSGGLSWVSPLDFPELQPLDRLFSFHPYKEVVNSGEDLTVEIASWEPKQSQSSVATKKELEPHLFTIFKDSTPFTPLDPITASNHVPSHSSETHLVQKNSILSSRSLVSFPSAVVHLQPPTFHPSRTDSKKTMIRKNNVKGSDLLPPLHPRKCLASQQHLQPRSLSQFSPSRVAVTSFTADINASLNSGQLSELRYPHTSGGEDDLQEASDSLAGPPSDPITACTKDDHFFLLGAAQMQRLGAPSGEALKMPCAVEQNLRTPLVIPVSVPVLEGTRAVVEKEDGEPQTPPSVAAEEAQDSAGSSKKTHHIKFLKTLFVPSPMTPKTSTHLDHPEQSGQWCQTAGDYLSQLCSPIYPEHHLSNPSFKAPPYTPPPMLSPLQSGTALYLSTLPSPHHCPPLPSTQTTPQDAAESISLAVDETVVTVEPRINVGPQFQAEIPALQNVGRVIYDEHPAQLVWAPWGDLASNPQTQQQVEELLKLCCSSVVPGGGANTELALHCLHEVQGDVLAALELLLIKGDYRSASHPMLDYHYPGSVQWSPQEKRAFGQALMAHGKDFQLIQRMLQGKSVAQCVEYYYAIKKAKHLKQRSKKEKKKGGVADSVSKPSAQTPVG
ncbi:uncharacterized protein znf541 isoform X2 [Scleropages formosus]|uniref:uncharacterized protein znf541 isoform X2 n=1 Tax=Scleropages formosus TaxID=113540 RepID=UPI0008789DDF|nr:uncharacterized protein LOC108924816 isoform X2 [Scleropages formosus]